MKKYLNKLCSYLGSKGLISEAFRIDMFGELLKIGAKPYPDVSRIDLDMEHPLIYTIYEYCQKISRAFSEEKEPINIKNYVPKGVPNASNLGPAPRDREWAPISVPNIPHHGSSPQEHDWITMNEINTIIDLANYYDKFLQPAEKSGMPPMSHEEFAHLVQKISSMVLHESKSVNGLSYIEFTNVLIESFENQESQNKTRDIILENMEDVNSRHPITTPKERQSINSIFPKKNWSDNFDENTLNKYQDKDTNFDETVMPEMHKLDLKNNPEREPNWLDKKPGDEFNN